MKKILSTITIGCLAMGLIAAPALAQQPVPNKTKFNGNLVRSSELIGADLFNTSGKDIGQLSDVFFDENNGRMSFAVLAAGGFIGIGDKLTPVSWQSIQVKEVDKDNFNVVTTLDKTKLAQEKSFDKNRPVDQWMKEMPGTAGKKFVRMSTVDDAKLFDKSGHHIGGIKDIVLDTKTGKVAYAAVAFEDEFINKGDQMTMVPWTMVRQSEKNTPGYVLHADKTKLEGATFFAPNAWPSMTDLTWHKQVYDYYAVSPYFWTGA